MLTLRHYNSGTLLGETMYGRVGKYSGAFAAGECVCVLSADLYAACR